MLSFPRSRGSYDDYNYDDEDDGFSRIETLESRATFRILQPKKKHRKGLKPASVKLPDSGSTSEAETPHEAGSVSSSTLHQFTKNTTATIPAKINYDKEDDEAGIGSINFYAHPTPRGPRLEKVGWDHDAVPALVGTTQDSNDENLNTGDSELQTQEVIDKAMLHLKQALGDTEEKVEDDDFDCLSWDPDLPPATTSESPEPVQIKPQPVAYTTVGSLVDPNAKPQFAPPKRVNREGAGRAPLMTMLPGSRYESYYQPSRGPPPSLNKANSMAYAQQIARSPHSAQSGGTPETSFSTFPQSSRPTPPKEDLQLTDQEREILLKMRREKEKEKEKENKPPQSTTVMTSPSTPTPSSATRLSAHAPPFSSMENLRAKHLDSFQEAESQPNVPKLSKLESGVERFPLFSNTSSSPRFQINPEDGTDDGIESSNSVGELNLTYQFPPLRRSTSSSTSQTNPLISAFGKSKPPAVAVPNQRPGYPQPLTAGPPGQRHRQSATIRPTTTQMENNAWANAQPNSAYSSLNTQQQSPWSNTYIAEGTPNIYANGYNLPHAYLVKNTFAAPAAYYINPTAPSKVIDTLPPKSVAQYYPQGIPANMSGYYTPLFDKTKKQMDRVSAEAEVLEHKKRDDINEWFYSGQRRFATMTTEDYITELEELEHPNPYGPIAPPKKDAGPGPIIKKPFTVEEINAMPLEKAVAPLLNNAFGTMLSYAAEGVSSRKKLSGWVVAPADQIDDTQEGNRSLFGEDWGMPPRMVRSRTLQRSFA